MAVQGCHLCFKSIGNIAEIVRFFSTPEQYFLNLVRLKPLLVQVGISPVIAGLWEDGIQHDLTGDAVVVVPDISPVRVAGGYYLRSVGSD